MQQGIRLDYKIWMEGRVARKSLCRHDLAKAEEAISINLKQIKTQIETEKIAWLYR